MYQWCRRASVVVALGAIAHAGTNFAAVFGGTSEDYTAALASDSSGQTYLAGFTYSPDLHFTPGAFQPIIDGHYALAKPGAIESDAFVAKSRAVPMCCSPATPKAMKNWGRLRGSHPLADARGSVTHVVACFGAATVWACPWRDARCSEESRYGATCKPVDGLPFVFLQTIGATLFVMTP